MNFVYLNGNYLPREQASISVLDRGFLLGDGVYEVISVYHGKLFRAQEHLNRLEENLRAIQIHSCLSQKQWLHIFNELLKQNDITNQDKAIYLQVTRGVDVKRDQAFPSEAVMPTVFVMVMDFHRFSYDCLKKGYTAVTRNDIRWSRSHIKSLNLLPNVLLLEEAKQHQAIEAILIRDGHAIEGTRHNLFMVTDGVIITPPIDQYTLGGITRDVILELARENDIPAQVRPIPVAELFKAEEVWITSSVTEICPITKIDEKLINQGKIGAKWQKMINFFSDFIQAL